MRNCSGCCAFCPNPCTRGEIKGNQEKISPNLMVSAITKEEEAGASEAFDNAKVTVEETGLAVVENIGSYEVKKNIFGKEVVRKIK